MKMELKPGVSQFNIKKISIPSILVYEFNAIPSKSQTGFKKKIELDNMIQKFTWK